MQLAVLLAAPVIDIDGTAYVQAGLFLFLLLVLNQMVFKTWLNIRARRTEAIDGSLATAKALREEATQLEDDYKERMLAARQRTNEVRNQARQKGEGAIADETTKARAQAETVLESARAKIDKDASAVRAELDRRIDEIATSIVIKVMGRAA